MMTEILDLETVDYLSLREIAVLLGVELRTVYRWTSDNMLPIVPGLGVKLVRRADLLKFNPPRHAHARKIIKMLSDGTIKISKPSAPAEHPDSFAGFGADNVPVKTQNSKPVCSISNMMGDFAN